MTAKQFEFREINEPPILPKCYDTERQEYANLFECVGWLNEQHETIEDLTKENEQLKKQKPFLKIIDDYFIQYEDGELFNLHKPSDIRSLMHILNREHGYSELQCEYNDLEKGDME